LHRLRLDAAIQNERCSSDDKAEGGREEAGASDAEGGYE
jgi:hypothetical protein